MAKWRDEKGRFIKGNPGGPGRKPKAKELSYLSAFTDVMPRDEFISVLEGLKKKAARGDLQIIRFFTEYILGKPTQDVATEVFEGTRKIVLTWDDEDGRNTATESPQRGTETDTG